MSQRSRSTPESPATSNLLDIGVVIAESGLAASTLHLWERRGLISPAGRDGLRRQYHPEVLETIAVIVTCQRSGFTLAEIGALLAPGAFEQGENRLDTKLRELRQRRDELDAAITGIEHAMACTAESPLECDAFRSQLTNVLPVTRDHNRR
jgi:DNA-binding transcriptional MerR regulator